MKRVKEINWHCIRSVRIRSCFGRYFPAFRLNTERYFVFLRIQSECGKIRTRITSNSDTFHVVLDTGESDLSYRNRFEKVRILFTQVSLRSLELFGDYIRKAIGKRKTTLKDHKTIIRTGITCKKIPCYMRDSVCR